MSNCNASDQQSQRQINVKECFAYHEGNGLSLLLIHALKGGSKHSQCLSASAVEKFKPAHLQIFPDGVDLDFAGKIARYQVG